MPISALDQLEVHFPQIIELMPSKFDSHEFILALAQRQQKAYVRALTAYAHSEKPFMTVHGEIARRLLNHPTLVSKVGEHDSEDIFRQVNSAVVWKKLADHDK